MMKKNKVIVLLFAMITQVYSQNIGEWHIYSDMKDVKALSLSSSNVWAATTGGAFSKTLNDTLFLVLNKAKGFNSQALTSVAIDNQKKIWFGSQEGYIIVYDKATEKVTNILDIFKSDKSKKQINNIFISRDSAFISTDFGLSLINTNNLSFYDTFLKLGNFNSESKIISAYKSNLVYAITESGIAVQKQGANNLSAPESWNNYRFGQNFSIHINSASKILSFNGNIILATNYGLYRLVNNAWQLFLLEGIEVVDIYNQGSSLFIATKNKIYEFNGSTLNKLFETTKFSFTSITVSTDRIIYAGSSNGILEIKNNVSKFFYPDGPPKNQFVNLAVNSSGKLFVATGKNLLGVGFFEFDGSKWKHYNKESYPQLPSNDYLRVSTDATDKVYFANWGRGALIFDNGNFEIYTAESSPMVGIPKDPTFLAISDVRTDSKGNVWIANHEPGNGKYLSVLTKEKQWYHFDFFNPTLNQFDLLDRLLIDQNNTKWFVVLYGNRGIYYFNENNTFTNLTDDTKGFITVADGLISDQVFAIEVDKRGYIWIGTSQGVNVILDATKPKSTLKSSYGLALRNQTVNCIAIDPLDQKWIGTKQGVFVLGEDGITLINYYNSKNSPLPNDDIKSIAFDDKNGKVYIGTDNGLVMLQTSSIKPEEKFSELFIYPSPFIVKQNENNLVTIDGLLKKSDIKILDITGNLIKNVKSPGGRVAFWDGKDELGNYVSSGVYVIVAYDQDANNVATSKIAVIKK